MLLQQKTSACLTCLSQTLLCCLLYCTLCPFTCSHSALSTHYAGRAMLAMLLERSTSHSSKKNGESRSRSMRCVTCSMRHCGVGDSESWLCGAVLGWLARDAIVWLQRMQWVAR